MIHSKIYLKLVYRVNINNLRQEKHFNSLKSHELGLKSVQLHWLAGVNKNNVSCHIMQYLQILIQWMYVNVALFMHDIV